MFFDLLKSRTRANASGRVLHDAAVVQSRAGKLYSAMAVPDTIEGRYELLTLHVMLLLDRLRDVEEMRQALFDTYVSDLDGALREMGVGDLAVGKRMKQLGAAFYGRAKAYDDAFKSLPSEDALRAVVARTVFGGGNPADAGPLASYVRESRERLILQSVEIIMTNQIEWGAL